LAIWSDQLSKP